MALFPNVCTVLVSVSFIILINLQVNVESKAQYVQPVLMGMQVAIPWDIANIWNRPVSFAPYLATFNGFALMYILFCGVITSPFGYFFGVPSQKYVLGTNADDKTSLFQIMLDTADQMAQDADNNPNGGSRSFAKPILRKVLNHQLNYPDFSENAFNFIPENINEYACQQLILCHAHATLIGSPDLLMTTYRVFSKSFVNIPNTHREAITAGLAEHDCETLFPDCSTDTHSILANILLQAIPEWLKQILVLPQMNEL